VSLTVRPCVGGPTLSVCRVAHIVGVFAAVDWFTDPAAGRAAVWLCVFTCTETPSPSRCCDGETKPDQSRWWWRELVISCNSIHPLSIPLHAGAATCLDKPMLQLHKTPNAQLHTPGPDSDWLHTNTPQQRLAAQMVSAFSLQQAALLSHTTNTHVATPRTHNATCAV
jgi:hypothetical protein